MKNLFFVLSLSLFVNSVLFSQARLVQSFIEKNINGNSEFGNVVRTAGDVNNDGYDDIIVGAYYYHSETGRAYIYYGGAPMDSIPDVIMTGKGPRDDFAYSVSTAGDVNGDGYDDVIVGAYNDNYEVGRAYIYYGGTSMDNIPDVTLKGDETSVYFGFSVSTAGDVNNDGYDDVVVGSPASNNGKGKVYVYFGGLSVDNNPDLILTGEKAHDFFGSSVSTAGDINKDGYDDIIVGAKAFNSETGKTYIYYGGPEMDYVADFTITGKNIHDNFGFSVSTAGDVNGDGYDDIIIGAFGYQNSLGGAFIYYGGSSMDSTANLIITGESSQTFGWSVSTAGDIDNDGYDDVIVGGYSHYNGTGIAHIYKGGPTMDNIADITITGERIDNFFGFSVSNGGDINGDGYDDILVGANKYNVRTGKVYIYYGASQMDNTADFTLTGEGAGNNFGYSVSTAGDVNNDGYDDIIVGAYGYNFGTGRAYIYFGGRTTDRIADVIMTGKVTDGFFGYSVSTAGDVNGDGYDDVIVGNYKSGLGNAYIFFGGESMDNIADVTLSGEMPNVTPSDFGYSVSTAGDINGDGYDDVIVGAWSYYYGTGRVYIYLGGSPMDSIADVVLTGENTNNNFGYSVSNAGDVNNDGYDDFIIGAYGYNYGDGKVYVYFGGSSIDTVADVIITENDYQKYCYFGYSVSTAGDVNGDGYDDVIVGAIKYNYSTGRAYVYYGGSSMDNDADLTLEGEERNDYFGYSVSTAGDINNDGYDDMIVGALRKNHNDTGKVYVYYGGGNTSAGMVLTGEGYENYFGRSVSAAGDINKDGYDDFIVGADGYWANGKCYVYTDPSAPVSVDNKLPEIPLRFELFQNYPNPFGEAIPSENPTTTISYVVPSVETRHALSLQLIVYDVLGREVATLVNKKQAPGNYSVQFNAENLPSGIYFYTLSAGGFTVTKKMILLK